MSAVSDDSDEGVVNGLDNLLRVILYRHHTTCQREDEKNDGPSGNVENL
jgi:hypothetical protein